MNEIWNFIWPLPPLILAAAAIFWIIHRIAGAKGEEVGNQIAHLLGPLDKSSNTAVAASLRQIAGRPETTPLQRYAALELAAEYEARAKTDRGVR